MTNIKLHARKILNAVHPSDGAWFEKSELERIEDILASLVSEEREACAMICEVASYGTADAATCMAESLAESIRARK